MDEINFGDRQLWGDLFVATEDRLGGLAGSLTSAEKLLDQEEVGFGVDADGVVMGGLDDDVQAILEEAKLLEALGAFECAGGQGGEGVERGLAISVEADVLPVLRCGIGRVAVVGDGGAGEVEGAAIGCGDDLDGVGIGDVLRGAEDFEGGDVGVRVGEGMEERGDVFGTEQRLVALDVDVDVGIVKLRDGVDAVSAAGEIGGGELHGAVELMAEGDDFVGVGGDQDAVELRAGARGFNHPREQRLAGDLTQHLARQAGGGEAGRNDAEDAEGSGHGWRCGLGKDGLRIGGQLSAVSDRRSNFTRTIVSRIIDELCSGVLRLGFEHSSCPACSPLYTRRCSSDG